MVRTASSRRFAIAWSLCLLAVAPLPAAAQTGLVAADPGGAVFELPDLEVPFEEPASEPCCADERDGFALGAAIRQALGFTTVQHVARLREDKTRRELGGPFLKNWFESVSHLGGDWHDGGKVFTNYVAHPAGGAVYAHIYRQNDRGRHDLRVGEPGYAGMLGRALLFSTVVSAQFELGPLSEASIGNVGLGDPRRMAWVDLVITPTLGTAWMVAEDVIDERLLDGMDRKNVVVRNVLRSVLNPSRSGANLARGKMPWYRERDEARRRR